MALVENGALMQLTAGAITGDFGEKVQQTAHWLLDQNRIHFVASDAHRTERRAPAMAAAHAELIRRYGREVAQQLTVDNPWKLTSVLFNQDRAAP